jgi:bifunctional ADP-heptose synthase (sugar kinase/adenylyltransferase)
LTEKLVKIVKNFKELNILIIGDIMLDEFIWGKVNRISPEAPVPVVNVAHETYALGGAANVANNITFFPRHTPYPGSTHNDRAHNL